MQFFLDTADLEAIKQYADWGIVDGITTNPTLMAKEGIDPERRIKDIAALIDGPISMEVVAADAAGMIEQAKRVATWHENIFAKIPMTAEGLKAVSVLSQEGISTNVTLVFSITQAILAAKAGATLVSPFVGRLDDIGHDGMQLVADIVKIFEQYGAPTQVLAASIRHPQHVVAAMKAGADIATIPPSLLPKLIAHPLTDKGLETFMQDWNNCAACKNLYATS